MKLLLAVLVAVSASVASAAPPKLDMTAFFSGKTRSENVLKIALQRPKKLIVESVGRKDGGQFVLVDTIREEGKPVRQRKWVMREAGPNHFKGTLSDAVGPVDISVAGDSATIRYVTKDGHLKVEQKLQLRADGESLSTRTVAKRFGMKFANVEGTVRKLD